MVEKDAAKAKELQITVEQRTRRYSINIYAFNKIQANAKIFLEKSVQNENYHLI